MASLFDGKVDVKTDSRYAADYSALTQNEIGMTTGDAYFLFLILGYRNGMSIPSQDTKGKEFRPSYFSSLQQNLLYGFALNLPDVTVEDMTDGKETMRIYSEFSAFANGGVKWLRANVFADQLSAEGAINADAGVVIERLNQMIHDQLSPDIAPF
ncbi:hypothetical protein [Lacticaseibacillus songhuajiangensis]|jgi:hypothetical protein|uniref:hypothetical protein n=1 Tax=Lacticaseibacillus songhuajiangensis TaxID=1296539 RepID=UPI000F7AE61F|nr:hypothetical protein [Lacticaseibacillus songhuajiangensis]